MTIPVTPPPLYRGSVVLTDACGNLRVARSPSQHPPACIVRSGTGPVFPDPFIDFDSRHCVQLAPQLRDLLQRAR